VSNFQHPKVSRRTAVQAGAIGLLGLGTGELAGLRALASGGRQPSEKANEKANQKPPAKAVIYIFLSGGLAQHDSFDLKPEAPDSIRGEFKPIATRSTGIKICEHLPRLAQRSQRWALVRSLTHRTNDHSAGHLMMLTGRAKLPIGFNPGKPQPTDWPSIAAVAGAATQQRNNLPPAVILPEKLIHNSGRVIPGAFAGLMGSRRDPWILESAPFDAMAYGAFPEFEFDHQDRPQRKKIKAFRLPDLRLPPGILSQRFEGRLTLMRRLDAGRRALDQAASSGAYNQFHHGAVSLLTDAKVRKAFDVLGADPRVLDRYGRNSFGYSLLMARRLVEAGVNLVQVNLGNNETWDTHGNAFPHLKDKLFPPTDRALSALLDDLVDAGLLGNTLVVMAGEFGRTPKISRLPQHYKLPGRDHWGAVQTVFLAGGGVAGGTVVGSSDRMGAYPSESPQTPENMAATIYRALGIPKSAEWLDSQGRPHFIYHGEPIAGLS
jgi:hypothetical protein